MTTEEKEKFECEFSLGGNHCAEGNCPVTNEELCCANCEKKDDCEDHCIKFA